MGWLKVAERLMHPFGEEDDDFELNYIFDRHVYVGFMIVDDLHGHRPAFTKDPFCDKEPWVPHTKASGRIKDRRPRSHFGLHLPFSEMELNREKAEMMSIEDQCKRGFFKFLNNRRPGSTRRGSGNTVILDSEEKWELGVAIVNDRWWLFTYGVLLDDVIDLRHIAERVKKRVPNQLTLNYKMGLKSLATHYFGDLVNVAVSESRRRLAWSNWAQQKLTPDQLHYAVFDSQVAIDIFGVSAQKLCPGLAISRDGKVTKDSDLKRLRSQVSDLIGLPYEPTAGSGDSSNLGYHLANFDISPNVSDDEIDDDEKREARKAAQFYNQVTDPVIESSQAGIPGFETAMNVLMTPAEECNKAGLEGEEMPVYDGGRLPLLVRKATVYLSEDRFKGMTWSDFLRFNTGKLYGYATGILDRLRKGIIHKLCDTCSQAFPLYSKFHNGHDIRFQQILQYEAVQEVRRNSSNAKSSRLPHVGLIERAVQGTMHKSRKVGPFRGSPSYASNLELVLADMRKSKSFKKEKQRHHAVWAEIAKIAEAKQERKKMEVMKRVRRLNKGYIQIQSRRHTRLEKMNTKKIGNILKVKPRLSKSANRKVLLSLPSIMDAGRKKLLKKSRSNTEGKLKDSPLKMRTAVLEEVLRRRKKRGGKQWVSCHPCWRCGETNVKTLIWEPIVPAQYLQFVLNCEYECTCNWVLICVDCAELWRQRVFDITLELGAACGASLEIPKLYEEPQLVEVEEYTSKIREIEETISKRREEWRLRKREKKRVPGSEFRCHEERELRRLQCEARAILKQMDACRDSLPQQSAADLDKFVIKNKYQLNSDCDFHEIKVCRALNWDMVLLERIFRDSVKSFCLEENGGAYFPTGFKLDHEHDALPKPWIPGDPESQLPTKLELTKEECKFLAKLEGLNVSSSDEDESGKPKRASVLAETDRDRP